MFLLGNKLRTYLQNRTKKTKRYLLGNPTHNTHQHPRQQESSTAAQSHRTAVQQSTPTAKIAETPAALRVLSLEVTMYGGRRSCPFSSSIHRDHWRGKCILLYRWRRGIVWWRTWPEPITGNGADSCGTWMQSHLLRQVSRCVLVRYSLLLRSLSLFCSRL